MKTNLNTKFMDETSKIKDPAIFLGLARVLKVKLIKDEKDENEKPLARDFMDIYVDVVDAFARCDRRRKRELLNLLRKANAEDGEDANRTENTKTNLSNEEM